MVYNKQFISSWIQFSTFLQHFEAAKTQQFLARRVPYLGTSDPASITDNNIRASIESISNSSSTSTPATPIAYSRRVSAADLESHIEPTLHEHYKLSQNNKILWDEAYLEEYLGLHEDTQTGNISLKTNTSLSVPSSVMRLVQKGCQPSPFLCQVSNSRSRQPRFT